MTLWRISNHADLKGIGGLRASGRWHTAGRPVVYLAEHPALCLLEVLAHDLETGELPLGYRWLKVATARGLEVESAGRSPGAWMNDVARTRTIGDRWLVQAKAPLLKVPSALAPESFNYLLNPLHPKAGAARIVGAVPYPLDSRLARR